jgi:sorbitol-specific phosphotransferase system component IIA
MKVRVYFCKESDAQTVLRRRSDKIGKQALDTIYDLVWEVEFKNILNVGRIWLKFKEEERPFGISLSNRRSHDKISPGDIIQIANDFYMVNQIGATKVKAID